MPTEAKTWIVVCPQETPVVEYTTLEEANTAATAASVASTSNKDFLIFEKVGGLVHIRDYAEVTIT
jgi:hypothetical protein